MFYSLFRISESIDNGYNITEDHTLITTKNALEKRSFTSEFEQLVTTDMETTRRFRPLWVFYSVLTAEMFGMNLLLFNIFTILICILTSFFLFKFASNIGFSDLQSILFALITLIGPATEMYIMRIDAEILGMLMLSVSLYFLSKSIFSDKRNNLYKVLFIISILFTATSKESFLITIPAILFLYLWIYGLKNKIGIFESFKKNIFTTVTVSIILLLFTFILVRNVGIDQHAYAGVDSNSFSVSVIIGFLDTIISNNFFFIILIGLFIFFENELQNNKLRSDYIKQHSKNLFFIILFALLVLLPQLALYFKSGFLSGRYYLPYLIGYTFFVIYILKIIFDSKTISKYIKYLYLSSIIAFIVIELISVTIPSLVYHSRKCKASTQMIETIAKDNHKDLLVVLDPAQNYYEFYSLKLILEDLGVKLDYQYDFIYFENKGKLYSNKKLYDKVLQESTSLLGDKLIDSTKDNSRLNNILIFGGLDNKFIEKNGKWFNTNNYRKKKFVSTTKFEFGSWILYTKK